MWGGCPSSYISRRAPENIWGRTDAKDPTPSICTPFFSRKVPRDFIIDHLWFGGGQR